MACVLGVVGAVACGGEARPERPALVWPDAGGGPGGVREMGMQAMDMASEDAAPVPEDAGTGADAGDDGVSPRALPLPQGALYTLGQTPLSIPLVASVFGEHGPVVLVLGGMRPDEKYPLSFGFRFESMLLQGMAQRQGVRVVWMPLGSPDALLTQKNENGRGVDVQYNFDTADFVPSQTGGSAPFSETEAQVVRDLVQGLEPALTLSVRAGEGAVVRSEGGRVEAWAAQMAQAVGVGARAGSWEPGSFEGWMAQGKFGPTLMLELPAGAQDISSADALSALGPPLAGVEAMLGQVGKEAEAAGVDPGQVLEALSQRERAAMGRQVMQGFRYGTSEQSGLPLQIVHLGREPRKKVLVLGHPAHRTPEFDIMRGALSWWLWIRGFGESLGIGMLWEPNPEGAAQWVEDFAGPRMSASAKALEDFLQQHRPHMILVVGYKPGGAILHGDGSLDFKGVEVHSTDHLRLTIDRHNLGADPFVQALRAKGHKVAQFFWGSDQFAAPRRGDLEEDKYKEATRIVIDLLRNNSR